MSCYGIFYNSGVVRNNISRLLRKIYFKADTAILWESKVPVSNTISKTSMANFQSLLFHKIFQALYHCVKSVQKRSFFWSVFSRSLYSVRMRENTDQKKLRIWTLFTQHMFRKSNIFPFSGSTFPFPVSTNVTLTDNQVVSFYQQNV